MTERALVVLFHMLGMRPEQRKLDQYRNHYVAGKGHHRSDELAELEALGLVVKTRPPGFLPGGSVTYMATAEGKEVARRRGLSRVPKLSRGQERYRRWLRTSDLSDITFGDWLRAGFGAGAP